MGRAAKIGAFDYRGLPHRVLFGPGRVAELADVVRGFGCAKALILSTPEQRDVAERVSGILGDLAAGIFAGAAMHTPVEVTEAALARYAKLGADCIVSVGGGSTTGLGKAISLRSGAPQLAIATTYAGSEVTPILGETKDGVKTTQRSDKIVPNAVIYDVELTLSLPLRLSATSGLNAMAHAVEALYARDGNPIVSLMAEEGLRAFAEALPRVAADPRALDARTLAQYGAWLCGMCLAQTSMALHHKLCHVLGGAFDLPHAETHAIVLPHATAYNALAAPEAMARIARAIGADDPATGLYGLARSLKIPLALKDIGMPADGVDRVAAMAAKDPYWNPRPIEADAIRDLIRHAYEGAPPPAVRLAT
ncbi:MAG: maleylacetate reductase [Propylenella sp.]